MGLIVKMSHWYMQKENNVQGVPEWHHWHHLLAPVPPADTYWKLTLSTWNLVSKIPEVNTRQRSRSCRNTTQLHSWVGTQNNTITQLSWNTEHKPSQRGGINTTIKTNNTDSTLEVVTDLVRRCVFTLSYGVNSVQETVEQKTEVMSWSDNGFEG